MNGRFGLKVTIDGKSWLLEWLTEIRRFIGQLLAEFSEPPTDVLYIPPDFLDSTQ
jgi:predicted transcriptional regulator